VTPESLPLPQKPLLSILVDMSAARVSRAQQQRARLKIVEEQLKEAVDSERAAFLEHCAQVERDYLHAVAVRKQLIKDYFATDPKDRPAQVNEVAASMGLSRQRINQINALK
jgi:hypothetical protein